VCFAIFKCLLFYFLMTQQLEEMSFWTHDVLFVYFEIITVLLHPSLPFRICDARFYAHSEVRMPRENS
jgi:hypothetical protein